MNQNKNQSKNKSLLYTYTQMNYMVLHCLYFFQQVDSNRYILKSLT